ncbi:hypothetical protein G7Y89_g2138 [Cudoniella acicularis]|uniref:Uncharacterized protein n=1 Tax=Cudoniella acicularis TaxID=354080 RepID=A0A8H4W6S0_9HELO|nr:hypothetical protein G7Y89_g2138 [Cudoniella acicularis]
MEADEGTGTGRRHGGSAAKWPQCPTSESDAQYSNSGPGGKGALGAPLRRAQKINLAIPSNADDDQRSNIGWPYSAVTTTTLFAVDALQGASGPLRRRIGIGASRCRALEARCQMPDALHPPPLPYLSPSLSNSLISSERVWQSQAQA